jgi:FG-GAP-like repeat/FG-GAP repeat
MAPLSHRLRIEELESRELPSVNVLTWHNDTARDGENLNEPFLTPADVNSTQFGKLFSVPVDGQVYAQPLVVTNVSVPGKGVHNLVFVATEHDSVYAWDADTNLGANAKPIWQDSFINPAAMITTVPSSDVNCGQITPEIGITGTPVIDPTTNTLYVVAMTKEVSGGIAHYVQRLHALDVATGAEKFGGPVIVSAVVMGTGDGGTTDVFNPFSYKERPGLLLVNGVVYTSWSSHCDIGTYHGWIIGYSAVTLQETAVFNVTPDGQEASVWQSGAGPAADAAGNIYFLTGNGTFDANTGGRDYGDAFLKLSTAGGLSVSDYFTPFNQDMLSNQDLDLGSGGVMLLPAAAGSATHPDLMTGAGKGGEIYLVDRDHPGEFNASADQIVQEFAAPAEFGTPAYFNNTIYYGGVGASLNAFHIANAQITTTPTSQTATVFGYPGTTPSVSANGSQNGIVWAIELGSHAILHAYDAANLGDELYSSDQSGTRDQLDAGVKFSVPTIANGKVYVGTSSQLTVFGLLGNQIVATGADFGGGPEVKVFTEPGRAVKLDFYAYDPHFEGGVNVAVGDLNGDGIPDIVTAPASMGGPDIRVFDGRTGALIREFMAYDPRFSGGVNVAVGDVNHDGTLDIITGAGAGGGPEVKVFSGTNNAILDDFYAYDPRFSGGVRVAAGDVNGDGFADIITGAGPGGGPHVKVFSGNGGTLLYSFFAYDPHFTGGVYVAAGDVNHDGKADIITGAGAGGGPHVEAFSGADGSLLRSFYAYSPSFNGGVRVSSEDLNGDGFADILTAAGLGGNAQVVFFNGANEATLDSFNAYDPRFQGGVFIGGR